MLERTGEDLDLILVTNGIDAIGELLRARELIVGLHGMWGIS
jgi:hypothetical protein